MLIASHGFMPANPTIEDSQNWRLFCNNLTLILNSKQQILNCCDYFFVTLPGAYCSYPFVNTDGILFLGYLLIGWEQNILTDTCIKCQAKVIVFWFCGSILSGRNQWKGICLNCRNEQLGQWQTFGPHWQFVSELRKKYPDKISEWQEYDGFEFSFGGNGLKPARKKKLIWRQLAQSVSLQTLVNELTSSSIRQNKAPNVCLLKHGLELKPFSRS
jgi:hypothetical protein